MIILDYLPAFFACTFAVLSVVTKTKIGQNCAFSHRKDRPAMLGRRQSSPVKASHTIELPIRHSTEFSFPNAAF